MIGSDANVAAEFEPPLVAAQMSEKDFEVRIAPATVFGLLGDAVETDSLDGGYRSKNSVA